MLVDSFNRIHNYLRISITANCNLRCFYCMPGEDYAVTPAAHLMQANEIEALARVFVSLGINKIRLTGGEPLVRKDAADIITRLAQLPVELTLTTNATRVHHFLPVLKTAGIRSVNVSLDTLDKEKFHLITRRNQYDQVLDNIQLLLENDVNVKVNVVAIQGVNDAEIINFIALTRHYPLDVRFIEFMPFDGNRWQNEKVLGYKEILDIAATKYDYIKINDQINDTAKKYKVPGHAGTFAVISTITAPFCGDCNRLRLTADGKLKNCLFSQSETDLLTNYRNGRDIIPIIKDNVMAKKAERGGQFGQLSNELDAEGIKNRSMIAIGG